MCIRDRKKRTSFTLLLAVLFIGFFSNDLYQLMQFTKTATVTIGCGCFFLITAIVQENISYKRLLLGACYVFIGTMIRNKCFYITVAFLFLTCCLLFLRHLKPVSYTHLDVYKSQVCCSERFLWRPMKSF